MSDRPAVEFRDVFFSYDGHPVLESLTAEIEEGDFAAVIGPNGGGKSTLLKLVLGLLRPDRGEVLIFGRSPRAARDQIGYVPQFMTFDRSFPIRVQDVVLMGLLSRSTGPGGYRRSDVEEAVRALQQVELADLRRLRIGKLSGGQLQRVLIARALVNQPRLLILDEPTANVDHRIEREIYDMLRGLTDRMTIVMVTHDISFVAGFISRVLCLNRRLFCHPTSRIDSELIEKLYEAPVRIVHHDRILGNQETESAEEPAS